MLVMSIKCKRVNATGGIHDDFCKDKTPEDVQRILDRCAEITLPELRRIEAKKKNITRTG